MIDCGLGTILASATVFRPAYLARLASGSLDARVSIAWDRLAACDLCARYCRVNRFGGIKGAVCRTGEQAVVASFGPHHGEERPLRGWRGSGTIFFAWCNLRCVYCQNWDISQKGEGRAVSPDELAAMMLSLQGFLRAIKLRPWPVRDVGPAANC